MEPCQRGPSTGPRPCARGEITEEGPQGQFHRNHLEAWSEIQGQTPD